MVQPFRLGSFLEGRPLLKQPICYCSMLSLFPSALLWKAISLLLSFLVAKPSPPLKKGEVPLFHTLPPMNAFLPLSNPFLPPPDLAMAPAIAKLKRLLDLVGTADFNMSSTFCPATQQVTQWRYCLSHWTKKSSTSPGSAFSNLYTGMVSSKRTSLTSTFSLRLHRMPLCASVPAFQKP